MSLKDLWSWTTPLSFTPWTACSLNSPACSSASASSASATAFLGRPLRVQSVINHWPRALSSYLPLGLLAASPIFNDADSREIICKTLSYLQTFQLCDLRASAPTKLFVRVAATSVWDGSDWILRYDMLCYDYSTGYNPKSGKKVLLQHHANLWYLVFGNL